MDDEKNKSLFNSTDVKEDELCYMIIVMKKVFFSIASNKEFHRSLLSLKSIGKYSPKIDFQKDL
jgi:hypothetical protein